MKKWLCILLICLPLLSCSACYKGSVASDESSSSSISPTLEKADFTTTYVNHTYTIISRQEEESSQPAKILTATDKASGKTIQTLRFIENEWFTKEPLYFIDITFDGNADLLVPFSRPASGAYFQAYVWDEENGQYRHIPSFENLSNVVLDAETRTFLTHKTASQITSYGMYTYRAETKEVIPIRSLYWELQEDRQSFLVTETTYADDDTAEQVLRFSVSAAATGIDKTDTQIAPYFNSNSVWNIDSNKWTNTVIPYIELLY